MMRNLLVIIIQFISGSIMYSYLIAKMLHIDLRKVRDGNPGGYNLWISAGWKFGLLGIFLDYFKGMFPLNLFIHYGIVTEPNIISLAALAGIAGHAFSPMLYFNGGKAIATSFGAWTLLTNGEAVLFLGIILLILVLIFGTTTPEEDAKKVIVGFSSLSIYVAYKVLTGMSHLLILYIGNLSIIYYKHRKELLYKRSNN
ncbi:MAG: hypothetical protein CBR30_03270 [Dictyoglomus sp. NZ13-RE01]|nr:MAG: hypothetical protein CBR30_03270 [Dictyoglomus sp. NZ13-RE01]